MSERFTPFLWLLFSAGGTVAAFLFPAHLFLTGLAVPLGWVDAPAYESLRSVIQHPIGRLYFFVLISLPLFHWAHRFLYTLKDALQLHSTAIAAVLCYGTALIGTLVAAYTLWNIQAEKGTGIFFAGQNTPFFDGPPQGKYPRPFFRGTFSSVYYIGRFLQLLGMWILLVDLFTAGPSGPSPQIFAAGVVVFVVGWLLARRRGQVATQK